MITKQFVIFLSCISLFLTSGMDAVDTAAQEESISLQDLRYYCSHLSSGTPITFQDIQHFTAADWGRVAAIFHCHRAQQLYFCKSHIGDEGAINIATMVGNMPYLTYLSLRQTSISVKGLSEICDALNNRPQNEKYPLLYLDVRDNGLTNFASIKSLLLLAKSNPQCEICNDFFDKDAAAEMIKKMSVLNKSTAELPSGTPVALAKQDPVVDNNCDSTPRIGERRGIRNLFGLGNSQSSIDSK